MPKIGGPSRAVAKSTRVRVVFGIIGVGALVIAAASISHIRELFEPAALSVDEGAAARSQPEQTPGTPDVDAVAVAAAQRSDDGAGDKPPPRTKRSKGNAVQSETAASARKKRSVARAERGAAKVVGEKRRREKAGSEKAPGTAQAAAAPSAERAAASDLAAPDARSTRERASAIIAAAAKQAAEERWVGSGRAAKLAGDAPRKAGGSGTANLGAPPPELPKTAPQCEGAHVYIVTYVPDEPSASVASLALDGAQSGTLRRVGQTIGGYEVAAITEDWSGLNPTVWLRRDGKLCRARLDGNSKRGPSEPRPAPKKRKRKRRR